VAARRAGLEDGRGLGLSQQSDYNRDWEHGFFRQTVMQRSNVTISFDDTFYLRPRTFTVRDGTTGAPVDPFAVANYSVVSTQSQANKTHDQQRTAYGSIRRDFHTKVPFTLKAGFDLRESSAKSAAATRSTTSSAPTAAPARRRWGTTTAACRFSTRSIPSG
jgi:hypothetical protein